jgi:Flp pilus assembly protein TadG
MGDERGSALVEMALSSAVYLSILFGIIQLAIAGYFYNITSEAAREATRYAVIRGYNSCLYATSTFPNCNLGPDASGNATASTALKNYLVSRHYPGASNLQVTANWLSPTGGSPNAWSLSCATALDQNITSPLYGNACNYPGHAVQVQVTLQYPLAIPFVAARNLSLSSTSQMVISE